MHSRHSVFRMRSLISLLLVTIVIPGIAPSSSESYLAAQTAVPQELAESSSVINQTWIAPNQAIGNTGTTQLLNRALNVLRQPDADSALMKSALRDLQERLLGPTGDAFVTTRVPATLQRVRVELDQRSIRTVKQVVEQALTELPPKAREIYELTYGPEAAELLKRGKQDGDFVALRQAAHQYLSLDAGAEAAYFLASSAFDGGRLPEAFQLLKRLSKLPAARKRFDPFLSVKLALIYRQQANEPAAQQTLSELSPQALAQLPKELKTADGQVALDRLTAVSVASPASEVALSDWTHFMGAATRQAVATAVAPTDWRLWDATTLGPRVDPSAADLKKFRYDPATHNGEWEAPSPQTESELAAAIQVGNEIFRARIRESRQLALPAAHPLVVNDLAIVRTLAGIRAFDLKSGVIRWDASTVDPAYADLFAIGDRWKSLRQRVPDDELISPLQRYQHAYLETRTGIDRTVGTLSSDGRAVYFLDACGVADSRAMQAIIGAKAMVPRPWNRLCAINLATVQTRWVKGPPSQHPDEEQVGEFYLGAPTAVDGVLYVLSETAGSVRLVCLDPLTGRELWAEQVCDPYDSIMGAALRRVAACSPTYIDGLLICPTASGIVSAYDIAARRFSWVYGYPTLIESRDEHIGVQRVPGVERLSFQALEETGRWVESSIQPAASRLIIAPPDSNMLHCVDALSGEPQWRVPRGDGLYVAATTSENVIVVCQQSVEALHLTDGSTKWSLPLSGRTPSGRGIRVANILHLPVTATEKEPGRKSSVETSAEPKEVAQQVAYLLAIDLRDGRIVSTTPGPREWAFGNLAAGNGALVSQSFDRVTAFPSIGELESKITSELAARPNDPAALARRGRMRLLAGRESDGLLDLIESLKLRPDEALRSLVVEVAFEQLRADKAAANDVQAVLSQIELTPDIRAQLVELEADLLLRNGQSIAALNKLMALVDSPATSKQQVRTLGRLTVASRSLLATLMSAAFREARETAPRNELDAFNAALQQRLDAAVKSTGPEKLRAFIQSFGWHPLGDLARWELVTSSRLDPKRDFLERERHAAALVADPDLHDAGWLALLGHWLESDHGLAARATFDELDRRIGTHKLADASTVHDKLAELRASPLLKAADQQIEWPKSVAVKLEDSEAPNRRIATDVVPLLGAISPACRGWIFERVIESPGLADEQRVLLRARDPNGKVRWKLSLSDIEPSLLRYSVMSLHSSGHLMALSVSGFVAMLDLSVIDKPQILWVRNVIDFESAFGPQLAAELAGSESVESYNRSRWQILQRMSRHRQFYTGSVDLLTSHALVMRTDDTLTVRDSLTGQLLWSRRDVPRDARIIGDDRTLCIVPDNDVSVLLRMGDGSLQENLPLPLHQDWLTTQGCDVLTWVPDRTLSVITKRDGHNGKVLWSREYSGRGVVQVVDHELIFVTDSDGNLECLDAASATGEPLFRTPLGRPITAKYMHVLPNADGYVVLLDNRTKIDRHEWTQWPQPSREMSVVQGPFFGLAKDGSLRWTVEAREQEIILGQPREIPLVLLASTILDVAQPRSIPYSPRRKVLILDRRTGDILFNEAGLETGDFVELAVQQAPEKIGLRYSSKSIIATFGTPK